MTSTLQRACGTEFETPTGDCWLMCSVLSKYVPCLFENSQHYSCDLSAGSADSEHSCQQRFLINASVLCNLLFGGLDESAHTARFCIAVVLCLPDISDITESRAAIDQR
ncbi:hypothetical protein KCU61_g351, partial [Aureobasidium melanogenum]